ncbi:Quinidine resistance protein 3 [Beauveria bassiana D1-5]|uniref:Quinidine resistance protein 3 n=1 Tax=Beauveria bassiana D1-5 TaxID=1245745 RepID=A0A0A2VRM8_BEABA|nr:Quinidine resistance protein 3 [Beauveria bassiana D1-5]
MSVYYTVWQMSITAMSSLFKDRYGLSEMQIGLTFIANGVGCILGTLVNGRILDADYSRVKAQLAAAATTTTVPIAIPIISTFATGWAAISTVAAISTYLVDVFPDRSAAATASLNLARCLFAAGGTSFVMPMIGGIDVGWTFTICVAVQLLALVGPLVQYRYAGKWRMEMEKAKAAKAAKASKTEH